MTAARQTGVYKDESALLAALTGCAVLVVGDVMIDAYTRGEATRLSPEAPVPVLRRTGQDESLGGAANVAANLTGLGVRAHIVAAVGRDAGAARLQELLAACGVNAALIADDTRPTTVKTRYMAGPHCLLRVDDETTRPLGAKIAAAVLAAAQKILPDVQVMILSDYGKGVLTPDLIRSLIAAAKDAGVIVLVDPKGDDYTRYNGADAVTPNRKELAEAAGMNAIRSDAEIVAAARHVLAHTQINHIIATRSEDGISFITADDQDHCRSKNIPVADVSGAGDTVIATIAASLAAGADYKMAIRLANRAGAVVVGKSGAVAINAADLAQTSVQSAAAILSRAAAAAQVRAWQGQGLRVGFTNGCFDILHTGHVTYLQQARAHCDRLIIAANADQSVRRLKGPSRPVNPEDARAHVLAALGCVDMVVLFGDEAADDDKPCAVIEALRPDVIFKGGDYTEDQLPEAKIVRAYGGDVMIMGVVEGVSTTATIAKMTSEGAA